MIVIDNSSKEIKAVIDPGTGATINVENRPTLKAYGKFKKPAFMGMYSKQKEGDENVKEHT